ncbi:metabolite/drug transporter, putative [Plasmodium ovale curtisi]|uniref:Metabolite/drug transporter, putative n=2 Tax=Plasmodium ovale curtisi TaxID=864141 RepID=A0A1A8WGA3_PLAOA|nr:metabolite/drug transporter, putative [Plasmodium ovale curtisi]
MHRRVHVLRTNSYPQLPTYIYNCSLTSTAVPRLYETVINTLHPISTCKNDKASPIPHSVIIRPFEEAKFDHIFYKHSRFFDRINYSMRNTFLHDHYIFLKFKKNKIIGLLSIINSSVCLVISPLIGYYCDKHKKERTKILQVISITYLLVNIIHYMFIRTNSLSLIILITAISKMLHECAHVITESIFIESIEKGKTTPVTQLHLRTSNPRFRLARQYFLSVQKEEYHFYISKTNKYNSNNVRTILLSHIILPLEQVVTNCKNENHTYVQSLNRKNERIYIHLHHHQELPPRDQFLGGIEMDASRERITRLGFSAVFPHHEQFPVRQCPLSQKLSKSLGRAQVSLFFTTIGFLLLCSLLYINNYQDVLKVHVFRSVFQNCTNSIDKSILYDFIDTNRYTGRWMGVQSLYYLAGGSPTYRPTETHLK